MPRLLVTYGDDYVNVEHVIEDARRLGFEVDEVGDELTATAALETNRYDAVYIGSIWMNLLSTRHEFDASDPRFKLSPRETGFRLVALAKTKMSPRRIFVQVMLADDRELRYMERLAELGVVAIDMSDRRDPCRTYLTRVMREVRTVR